MLDNTDATPSIERAREDGIEKADAKATRERAENMSDALDSLNDIVGGLLRVVAAKHAIDEDALLLAYKSQDNWIPGPPNTVTGRLEWLADQIQGARGVVYAELSDPLAPDRPETRRRLDGYLNVAHNRVNFARVVWREQQEAEKAFSATPNMVKAVLGGDAPGAQIAAETNTTEGEVIQ